MEHMVNEELSSMRHEITQARNLLNDAIDRLVTSFMNIHALVQDADAERTAAAANAPAIADRIAAEVASAITALQFQDIMDQLLNHTLKRVALVELTLNDATEGASLPDGSGRPGTGARPVYQSQVSAGDIDMF
jgi:hypothetical protein